MQPGDNFRVAASPDSVLLTLLSNHDKNQGPDNADKLRIVHAGVAPTGTWADREIHKADGYASDVLPVWRLLHVEVDSMGPVHGNWIGGTIFGLGWAFTGSCPGPLYVHVGAGTSVMALALLCAVLGTWTYSQLRPRLPH